MVSTQPSVLEPDAQSYLDALVTGETDLMARVRRECEAEGLPAVSPQSGALLRALVAASRAERVLEVGCLLGYSALWMADARPGVRVDTIEMDAATADAADANFKEAGVADRVRVLRGRALDVLPTLVGPYDFVFLDASKAELLDYLVHARRLLRPGGVVAADNVLWSGRVWDAANREADTVGVREFTRTIHDAPDLVTTIIPVGDGLSVSVLRE